MNSERRLTKREVLTLIYNECFDKVIRLEVDSQFLMMLSISEPNDKKAAENKIATDSNLKRMKNLLHTVDKFLKAEEGKP